MPYFLTHRGIFWPPPLGKGFSQIVRKGPGSTCPMAQIAPLSPTPLNYPKWWIFSDFQSFQIFRILPFQQLTFQNVKITAALISMQRFNIVIETYERTGNRQLKAYNISITIIEFSGNSDSPVDLGISVIRK